MASFKEIHTFPDSSNRSGICFGYATALEILRVAGTLKPISTRARESEIPGVVPCSEILDEAIERVEQIYPGFNVRKPAHILVRNREQRRPSKRFVSHLCNAPLSNAALCCIEGSLFVSSPAFSFVQMAAQLKDPLALMLLGFELCGTYQTRKTAAEHAYQVAPLTNTHALKDFVKRNPSLRGAGKARQSLKYIVDGSASPRETKLALLLGLPMMYGGYGLGMPTMNYEIENDEEATALSNRMHLRCDLCWPDAKLDIEYQSREMHTGEESRIRDSRRTNALASMGWTSINITNDELDCIDAMNTIADTIRKHLGKKDRVYIQDFYRRNYDLRVRLRLPT